MKVLRNFIFITLALGMWHGCAKEEALEFMNSDLDSSNLSLKSTYSSVPFGDFGFVELINLNGSSEITEFVYKISVGASGVDQFCLAISQCGDSPLVVSANMGTVSYGKDSSLKKNKELRHQHWVKITGLDLQPNNEYELSLTMDG